MKLRTLQLSLCFALIASSGLSQYSSAVDEFERMDELDMEMEGELGNHCPKELKQTTEALGELRSELEPLKGKLQACEGKLAEASGQSQQQLTQLQNENIQLKDQLKKGEKSATNAARFALYSQQLEGKLSVLTGQVKTLEGKTATLTQENNTLRQQLVEASKSNDASGQVAALSAQLKASEDKNAQLAQEVTNLQQQAQQTSTPQLTATPVSATASNVVSTKPAQKTFLDTSGRKKVTNGFQVEIKSIRRSGENMLAAVKVHNLKYEGALALLTGPDPTAVDDQGNIFTAKNIKQASGMEVCTGGHHIEFKNGVEYCKKQFTGSRSNYGSDFPKESGLNLAFTLEPIAKVSDNTKATRASFSSTILVKTGEEKFISVPISFDDIPLIQ